MSSFWDNMKSAAKALSDVENVKSSFKELKEGIAESARESFSAKHIESVKGVCPYCQKDAGYRDHSMSELLTHLGRGTAGTAGQLVGSGLLGKIETVSKLVTEGDGRSFPNYVCLNCQGRVMQCSSCKEIMPYADSAESHRCGGGVPALEAATAQPPQIDDVIIKLEKLGSLKERGLLTAEEFEAQKKKLLDL